ncbi:hypothetical protein ACFE04_021221 [Oxalis oulophora]
MSEYSRRSEEIVDRDSDEVVTSKRQLFPTNKQDLVADNYVSDTDESKEDMVEVEYEAPIVLVQPVVHEKGKESNIGVTSDGNTPPSRTKRRARYTSIFRKKKDKTAGHHTSDDDDNNNNDDDDEDTGAQIAPIIKLEEVVVSTGEENEDALLDL